MVKKGDVVARLDAELQRIQVRLMCLQASNDIEIKSNEMRLHFRKTESARVRELFRKKVTSKRNLGEANVERDLARFAVSSARMNKQIAIANLKQAEAQLRRRTIKSPIDGIVTEISLVIGELAHEQAPIIKIAEMHPLYVSVFLPIRLYGQIEIGTKAEVRPEDPIKGTYLAKVTVVDKMFDAASRTFGIRLEPLNKNYAIPGGLRWKINFQSDGA